MATHVAALSYYEALSNYLMAYPLKVMLVSGSFTFNPEVHQYRSSVFNETVGAGYAAGGIELSDVDLVLNTSNNSVELVASEIDFGFLTVNDVSTMVVYRSTGVASTDSIIVAFTFTPVDRDNETFNFLWAQPSATDPTLGVVARFGYTP